MAFALGSSINFWVVFPCALNGPCFMEASMISQRIASRNVAVTESG